MFNLSQNRFNTLKWQMILRHHPSAFLLVAQLISLALYAVVDENHGGRILLSAFGILVLALVAWVLVRSRKMRWITWVLVASALVMALLSVLIYAPFLVVVSSGLNALLYFSAAGTLIVYMMRNYRVTPDELFAAGATFTLLAWGFAYAYLACQTWLPGSFVGSANPGQPRTFIELLSLSFTNLTATGSGDIYQVSAPARVLVMLEQFAGVGYVAVVVSRLIGMTINRKS